MEIFINIFLFDIYTLIFFPLFDDEWRILAISPVKIIYIEDKRLDVSTIRGEKRFVKTSHEKVIDKEVEGRRMRMKEGKSKRTRERERDRERKKRLVRSGRKLRGREKKRGGIGEERNGSSRETKATYDPE